MNTVAQATSEHPQYSWNTWINRPAIKAPATITPIDLTATHVNMYDYTAEIAPVTRANKKDLGAEQAIIDTIKYMGWISLKDSDFCEYGKGVGQGLARRKAADRMLADGRVTLLGTWSNGIAVGPGKGFVPVSQEIAVDAPAPKKTAARTYAADAYCPMRYREGAACAVTFAPAPAMHGPAFVPKPRVRYIWPKMHGPFLSDLSPVYALLLREKQAQEEKKPARYTIHTRTRDDGSRYYEVHENGRFIAWFPSKSGAKRFRDEQCFPVQKPKVERTFNVKPQSAPTPIKPRTHYTPRVGDTVFVVCHHENGTTTDRVVNVTRVAADGHVFRGFDRRYGRVRNFQRDQIAHIELWDGGSIYDRDGKEVQLAA